MNLIVAILLSTLLYITQADDDFPSTLHLPPYPTKPNNISYYFDHEVYSLIENEKSQTIFHSDSEEKDDFYGTYHIKLYLIFEQFTNFTCLQFNNTREPVKNIGINFFVSKDDKNHVELSRNKENPTIVNLTEKVYKDPFLFRYFLAKALGFVPETQRIDKVSELNIFNDNIEEDFRKEYEESTYYFSYFFESDFDFKSAAMPNYNFSIKTPLKYPKKKVAYESTFYPYYELMMKRNYGFSFSDYKKISYMYCYNDYKEKFCNSGYSYNHGNFSTCLCPEGYAGRYCQIIKNFHHSNCPPELNIIANNPEYKEMTLRAEDNNC
uniref:Astacin domain-containing protein n=1 Tax=Strongyloides papillosus TaxID=174720 RepID=A0A0N5C3F6_STREA